MINLIFDTLSDELNTYLKAQGSDEIIEDKVQLLKGEPTTGINFPSNRICPILIRIEEEKILRQDDRYLRSYVRSKDQPDYLTAQPGIPLHLYIMFVARFTDYLEGLKNL